MTEAWTFGGPGLAAEAYRAEQRRERRERIATAVLAGFASSESFNEIASLAGTPLDSVTGLAVRWADALIAELDKEA